MNKRRKVSLKECLRRIKQAEKATPKMTNDDLEKIIATAKQSCHFVVDSEDSMDAEEEK